MLLFRATWMRITGRFKRRDDPMKEHRLTYRCVPTDIDPYMHMTNGRYPQIMDMGRFEFLIRSGIYDRMLKENFALVVGTISIRFRKEIKLWAKFDVSARVITWDDRWTYFEHKLYLGSEVACVAIAKIAWTDKNGRLPPARVQDIMKVCGTPPPATDLTKAKDAVDKLLVA